MKTNTKTATAKTSGKKVAKTVKAQSTAVSAKVRAASSKIVAVNAKTAVSRKALTRTETLKKDLKQAMDQSMDFAQSMGEQVSQKLSKAVAEARDLNLAQSSAIKSAKAGAKSLVKKISHIDLSKENLQSMIDTKALKKQMNKTQKSLKKVQKKMGLDQKPSRRVLSIMGLCLLMLGGLVAGRQAMASTASSLNTLGNQSQIMQKARPSIPANTYRVVQKRVIERDLRSELGISMGTVASGGDSYYETQNLGLQYDFHLNSRFSLGARYQMNFNRLTPEGKRVYDRAEAMAAANNNAYVVPDLDQPLSTALATVSFYPLYGKVSWFESTVSYFDFYMMLGAGQTQLKSGATAIGTGGIGMGMWWNQSLTTRLEARYQTYEDQIFTGKRRIEGAVATFTMGILL